MNNPQNQARPRHMIVVEDTKYRQTISLQEETYSIGRNPTNSIVIHSSHASRHHGTLMKRKNRANNDYSYWIVDGDLDGQKSRNGIYVNGEKCLAKELKNGDLINFGCDVNATYYAVHAWTDTIVDLTTAKSPQIEQKSKITYASAKATQTSLNLGASGSLNPKDTLQGQDHQDPLTKLPNRVLFDEYLSSSLKNASQYQSTMAVILLDINHFSALNKNWGYLVGDKILAEVAKQISASLRGSDIVARWGNDEFAILLPSSINDIEPITQRILKHITQPLNIDGQKLHLEYSHGCAIYPQDGQDAKTLLKKAEQTLLQHQKQTMIPAQSCDLTTDPQASKLLKAKTALQKALQQEEFVLYYQPQSKIQSGEISGIEAFVRWNHPKLGQISPQRFIPLAEQTNVIFELGEWILRTACSQNKTWQDLGLPPVVLSVNLSPLQLENPNFVTMVKQVLAETNLSPCWLGLEITEKALLPNPEKVQPILEELSQLEVHLSMDDFGSGYSCLNHLPNLPFDSVKISQTCVQELTKIPQNIAVISAAIALGNSLDIRVIAEGVETEKQFELLRNLDCREMQGYLLSQPLTEEDATQFLSVHQEQFIYC